MSIPYTSEQSEFGDTIRQFFAEKATSAYLRTRTEKELTSDTQLWNQLIELGLLSSFAPEALGGLVLGFRELGILAHESGRALLPEPIVDAAFAGPYLLGRCKDKRALALLTSGLTKIVSGQERVAYLCAPSVENVTAAGGSLTGSVSVALFAQGAGYFVLPKLKNGATEILIDLKSAGPIRTSAVNLVDGTQKAARMDLKGVGYISANLPEKIDILYGILKAAEIVGACERSVEMTIEHVKTRKQFDAPIGSFQAVQQKLADAYTKLSAMRAITQFAAWAVEADPTQVGLAGRSALLYSIKCGPEIIESCIQLHGGIGFTWEYDLHLYLRRVQMLSSIFGATESAVLPLVY